MIEAENALVPRQNLPIQIRLFFALFELEGNLVTLSKSEEIKRAIEEYYLPALAFKPQLPEEIFEQLRPIVGRIKSLGISSRTIDLRAQAFGQPASAAMPDVNKQLVRETYWALHPDSKKQDQEYLSEEERLRYLRELAEGGKDEDNAQVARSVVKVDAAIIFGKVKDMIKQGQSLREIAHYDPSLVQNVETLNYLAYAAVANRDRVKFRSVEEVKKSADGLRQEKESGAEEEAFEHIEIVIRGVTGSFPQFSTQSAILTALELQISAAEVKKSLQKLSESKRRYSIGELGREAVVKVSEKMKIAVQSIAGLVDLLKDPQKPSISQAVSGVKVALAQISVSASNTAFLLEPFDPNLILNNEFNKIEHKIFNLKKSR